MCYDLRNNSSNLFQIFDSLIGKTLKSHIEDRGSNPLFSTL